MTKLFNRAPAALAALLMMGAVAMASTAPAAGPRALIDGFHATLLNVMKEARALEARERFDRIEPDIARRFDIPLMIALASGTHWRSASPADRRRLEDAFRHFSAANYAAQFSDFSGESFETVGVQAGPRNTRLVLTRLHRPAGKPVAITYVTRATGTTWRIVDVLLDDGISELAVRRSEYSSILKSGGVDGLVRVLESKTAQLLKE